MSLKTLLVVCLIALVAHSAMGESVISKLKARVESGAAPCNKAVPAGPAPPKQFLDIRLPVVVDDYHAPVGGFNPSHINDKEVDVAARKILREIQAADAEAKANGDEPQGEDQNLTMTTEEHVAMKQLLLDADILVRAAAKLNAENGPITGTTPKKVAQAAVKVAAEAAKKANKKAAKKAAKAEKKAAAAAAAAPAAPAAPAADAPTVGATKGAATKSPKASAAGRVVKATKGAATKSPQASAALRVVKATKGAATKSPTAAAAGRTVPAQA
jgi:hypothetical protein